MTIEDASSKLVDVVTVADVDAEERVDDTLVEILKWVLYLALVTKLKLKLDREIEVYYWSRV